MGVQKQAQAVAREKTKTISICRNMGWIPTPEARQFVTHPCGMALGSEVFLTRLQQCRQLLTTFNSKNMARKSDIRRLQSWVTRPDSYKDLDDEFCCFDVAGSDQLQEIIEVGGVDYRILRSQMLVAQVEPFMQRFCEESGLNKLTVVEFLRNYDNLVTVRKSRREVGWLKILKGRAQKVLRNLTKIFEQRPPLETVPQIKQAVKALAKKGISVGDITSAPELKFIRIGEAGPLNRINWGRSNEFRKSPNLSEPAKSWFTTERAKANNFLPQGSCSRGGEPETAEGELWRKLDNITSHIPSEEKRKKDFLRLVQWGIWPQRLNNRLNQWFTVNKWREFQEIIVKHTLDRIKGKKFF